MFPSCLRGGGGCAAGNGYNGHRVNSWCLRTRRFALSRAFFDLRGGFALADAMPACPQRPILDRIRKVCIALWHKQSIKRKPAASNA